MDLDSAVFYSNDIKRIVSFYKDVVGLRVEYQQGDKFVSFAFPNGVRLGIKKAVEKREVPGAQTIFIVAKDIKKVYQEMKKMKLKFYKDLTEESWATEFSILDPDNNKVVFLKREK